MLGVRLLAALGAAAGISCLVAAALPGRLHSGWQRPADLTVGAALPAPRALTLGLLLLVLARGLAGRRRLAACLAGAALLIAMVAASPGHPPRVAALGALLAAVVLVRTEFITRPDARRLRQAGQLAAGALVVVCAVAGWDLAVSREPARVVGRTALAGLAPGAAPHAGALGVLVALGAAGCLAVAFAPAPPPPSGTPAQRAEVAQLVRHGAPDSLAPFATRHDKAYVFSPDRRAAIGYRVVLGTALAGGDPVGAPDAAEAAVAEFLAECARHGWRPGVLGAGERALPAWRRHGLRGLPIGDEAVLDLDSFGLASRAMRNVRQAVSRSRNAGVSVVIGPLDRPTADELAPVLAGWLAGRRERGFAMNLDHILVPRPDCVVAVARDAAGVPVAFARFAVGAHGRVLTLDVAPRLVGAPNGVVERLIVEATDYGRARGAAEVSLNFAGLRQVLESDRPLTRVVARSVHLLDRWIEVGPLYRFCAKFHPAWRPRRLLLRSWMLLPLVGAAAMLAEFGSAAPDTAGAPCTGDECEVDGTSPRYS